MSDENIILLSEAHGINDEPPSESESPSPALSSNNRMHPNLFTRDFHTMSSWEQFKFFWGYNLVVHFTKTHDHIPHNSIVKLINRVVFVCALFFLVLWNLLCLTWLIFDIVVRISRKIIESY